MLLKLLLYILHSYTSQPSNISQLNPDVSMMNPQHESDPGLDSERTPPNSVLNIIKTANKRDRSLVENTQPKTSNAKNSLLQNRPTMEKHFSNNHFQNPRKIQSRRHSRLAVAEITELAEEHSVHNRNVASNSLKEIIAYLHSNNQTIKDNKIRYLPRLSNKLEEPYNNDIKKESKRSEEYKGQMDIENFKIVKPIYGRFSDEITDFTEDIEEFLVDSIEDGEEVFDSLVSKKADHLEELINKGKNALKTIVSLSVFLNDETKQSITNVITDIAYSAEGLVKYLESTLHKGGDLVSDNLKELVHDTQNLFDDENQKKEKL